MKKNDFSNVIKVSVNLGSRNSLILKGITKILEEKIKRYDLLSIEQGMQKHGIPLSMIADARRSFIKVYPKFTN